MRPLSPEELLAHMEAPSHRGVFILGCLERRVTLYSQQVRALNLVHALLALKRLAPQDKVLVVGGGAGGLTAAAGLVQRGCEVTLLEKEDELLPLFSGNGTRWVHPHIYDWPAPDSTRERAGLPVLDWEAGLASQVAEQILAAWAPLTQRPGIEVHLQVDNLEPTWGHAPPYRVSWNGSWKGETGHRVGSFKAIILAVGFGLEPKHPVVDGKPYWENDSLHQPLGLPRKGNVDVLVSGTGDGGLVDLFRLTLERFQHDRIVTDFLSQAIRQELSQALLDIEEELRRGELPPEHLYERYSALNVPKELDEGLKQRLRKRVRATLNGRSRDPLTPDASILNRFLASRLLRLGVTYCSDELGTIKKTREGRFKVSLCGQSRTFDLVVVRHGPEPALKSGFPALWKQWGTPLRARNELDQTRVPIWGPGDFGLARPIASGTGPIVPQPGVPASLPERIRFVGRHRELERLLGAICSEPPRPVVVLGLGGIGKSALTIAALHAYRTEERYRSRRYFVRLDSAHSADALLRHLAGALDVGPGPDLSARVKARLREAPALLVLDNAETPWEAEREATEALLQELAGLPGVALVVSVRGRAGPRLGSLSSEQLQLSPLPEMEARELFRSIAIDTPAEEPALTELVREVGGLPLAVVLLAREAEGVELRSVLQRWREERVDGLDGGARQEARFAGTLELALSAPGMSPEASRLLAVLALFPDGVAFGDRGAVLPGSAAALAYLQRAALVYGEGERWRMSAPVREYIRETRPPSAEDKARALGVYLKLAQELGPKVGRLDERDSLFKLGAESGNIEVALLEEMDGPNVREAIDTMLRMNTFVRFSGLESTRPMERALALARQQGDENLQAQCLFTQARILQRQARYEEARRVAGEALRLFERTEDMRGRSKALQELGSVAVNLGELAVAEAYFQQAHSLREQLREERGMGYSLHGLGRTARGQGHTGLAIQRFEEALRLLTKHEDALGRAHCLRHLGELREDAGQLEEARAVFDRIGDRRNQGNCLLGLGRIARRRGRPVDAIFLCEMARGLFQQVHSQHKEALCLQEFEALRRG